MATKTKGILVATEPIVIVVGARPVEYERRRVLNRRTGEMQEIAMTDPGWAPKDPGDDGIPYVFRANQRIHPGHPAYESASAKPQFIPLDEARELELVDQ